LERIIKTVSAHPLTPVIVGWAIALDGPGNIVVRSYALGICCLWLCGDVWMWLRGKEWTFFWKSIAICIVWGISWYVSLNMMMWMLSVKLDEFQNDASQNLSAQAILPPGGMVPMATIFTVKNSSRQTFSAYEMVCVINYLQYDHVVFREKPPTDEVFTRKAKVSKFPMAPGGEDSDSCLEKYINVPPNLFTCADVTLKINTSSIVMDFNVGKKAFALLLQEIMGSMSGFRRTRLMSKPTA
jgi:hypothetical protein